ncbi:Unknown protein sequence [Pseudomonas savastanoi pv. glycinea]|uniref:Uncharacterized protein n=1 Tax=Pseudomonas savastanoi pv. glycinea TaxID=318 RepID=A0ABR5LCA7_PSESG|nr:Unknown protein sequence [Pseudomonas savastanoi pv. glycinea]KPC31915.1 Unknown protein sequence [Pseudomonas savastanoi pv. glycinea]KPC42967.1 Unknown protein sequence [Pseudomonas savastanoi pv. glycinea]KPC43690.1 Unknown protein sequence [Pseudomonas savastanoi pv. glycinea]
MAVRCFSSASVETLTNPATISAQARSHPESIRRTPENIGKIGQVSPAHRLAAQDTRAIK